MNCIYCFNKISRRNAKYCGHKCQQAYQTNQKIEKWLNGEITGYHGKAIGTAPFVRKYLKNLLGSQCSMCGWDEHHNLDNRSLTEIDHIDGDASNTTIDNLRILCPNCHSMTDTYKARNKSSKRIRNKSSGS